MVSYAYIALVLAMLIATRRQPLLFLRLAFLASPGLLCAVALLGAFTISPHLQISQTPEIYEKAIWLNALALVTARLGWSAGAHLAETRPLSSVTVLHDVSIRNGIILVFVGVVLWFVQGRGDTFFVSRYASDETAGLPLGNVNSIINILIGTVVYYLVTRNHRHIWQAIAIILAFKVVYANVLRGIRADALDTVILIYVILGFYLSECAVVRLRHLAAGAGFAALLYFIGIVRASFVETGLQDVAAYSFLTENDGEVALHISTLSNITATFTGFIWLADTGYVVEPARTYLGYVLRIPPEFIYPDRPVDLAWVFPEVGQTSGGGTFELGEAYLTLGVFGVAVVPAAIGGVFGYLSRRLRRSPYSIVTFVMLCALLAVFSRGAWYQSFAYFKSFITGLIWLVPILLVAKRMALPAAAGGRTMVATRP